MADRAESDGAAEIVAANHPDWQLRGSSLQRDLGPATLATDGLSAGLRAAASALGRELDIREIGDRTVVVIGADSPLTTADREVLSALDAIIVGTAPLPGGQDPG